MSIAKKINSIPPHIWWPSAIVLGLLIGWLCSCGNPEGDPKYACTGDKKEVVISIDDLNDLKKECTDWRDYSYFDGTSLTKGYYCVAWWEPK